MYVGLLGFLTHDHTDHSVSKVHRSLRTDFTLGFFQASLTSGPRFLSRGDPSHPSRTRFRATVLPPFGLVDFPLTDCSCLSPEVLTVQSSPCLVQNRLTLGVEQEHVGHSIPTRNVKNFLIFFFSFPHFYCRYTLSLTYAGHSGFMPNIFTGKFQFG